MTSVDPRSRRNTVSPPDDYCSTDCSAPPTEIFRRGLSFGNQ